MAAGISIDIAANTRDFQRGVTDVEQSLGDVSDSLDDLARDTERSAQRVENSLSDSVQDGARDGERSVERLERSFRDYADTARRESRTAGNAIEDNTRDSTRRASEDLEELGDEAKSNLSEVVSSFDGSVESIGDLVQGTLGGIVGNMGPVGAALGAAGALLVGGLLGALGQADEDTAAYKERVSELSQAFIEAGRNGETTYDYLVEKLQELATATDSVSLKELAKIASGAEADFKDLAQAYAGNSEGLDELWRASERQIRSLKDESAALDQTSEAGQRRAAEYSTQIDFLERYQDKLGQAAGAAREAAANEEYYVEAGGRAMETRAAAVESYQAAIDDSLGSFGEFKDAETGALDPAAYLAGIQARIDATGNFNANVQSIATQFGLTDAEVQAILDQGLEFGPMLQSIIDSGLAPEFVSQLQSAVGGGQDVLNGADLNGTVEVDADTGDAKKGTDAFTSQKRETTVNVKADTGAAQATINATANAYYSATIRAGADTSSAQADVDRFIRRNDGRTYTITQLVVDRSGKPVNQ